MYKNSQGLNAIATSISFIMNVTRFSCLHVHNICAKLFVSSMNIAAPQMLETWLSVLMLYAIALRYSEP